MRKTLAAVLMGVLLLFGGSDEGWWGGPTRAAPADWLTWVQTRTACSLEAAAEAVKLLLVRGRVRVTDGCQLEARFRRVAVIEIASGPYTDHEGDTMYIVRIVTKGEGDWYTIAWPGMNAPVKPGQGV